MSRMKTCAYHGVFAPRHCPVCHKPLCEQCKTMDGCCSERCLKSRQKFGTMGTGPRPKQSIVPDLIKLAVVLGIAYAVAHYYFEVI